MKRLFVWVSLIATVLPVIAVILMGFGTPERNLFGIIASAYGLVALGVVLMTNQGVKRRNRGVLAMFIIGFWLIGFVSLCSFWMVWDQCVFHSPSRSQVFFPLWLNERAKEKIESAGGRKAYYERYGAAAVSTLLKDQTDQLNGTKMLLLGLLSTASLALPVTSGLALGLYNGRWIRPKQHPGIGNDRTISLVK